MDENEPRKRRRIIIDDDDEDGNRDRADNASDLGSNPDELLSQHNSDDDEGEDLEEHWLDDYAPAPELDYYDPAMLDEEEVYESYEKRMRDRLAAEEELDALDARRRAQEEALDEGLEQLNRFDRSAGLDEIMEEDYEEDRDEEVDLGADRPLNLEQFDVSLQAWMAEERTRREIFRRLKHFLRHYYEGIDEVSAWQKQHEGEPLPSHLRVKPPVYPARIKAMCAENSASLFVSYRHLARVQPLLAIWLTDRPRDMLAIFDDCLRTVVKTEFPNYFNIVANVHVRIVDLPVIDSLRDLRTSDLHSLIRLTGVVTRRTGVYPHLVSVFYECTTCGFVLGPFTNNASGGTSHLFGNGRGGGGGGKGIGRPDVCPGCQQNGPFRIHPGKTVYGNYQRLTVQETPGSVQPGRVPRQKEVILLNDLVDSARPGEEVDITGVLTTQDSNLSRNSSGFPLYQTYLEANTILKRSSVTTLTSSYSGGGAGTSTLWTEEEKRIIVQLSRDTSVGQRVVQSICPSIYGLEHVKTALALSLFGGVAKDSSQPGGVGGGSGSGMGGGGSGSGGGGTTGKTGMHRVRGDINVLLLGDPGTAKSQLLKHLHRLAPRAIYTTGKGASAVGLTAGVHRDAASGEWMLEGGALVLADQGICCIDEFDKMNDADRTSIHEAMEQQTISVSKAGIVTTLQARCSVVAAANPIGGRYDSSLPLAENVELTAPILQRFDVICILPDIVDPIADERLARFVVGSHMRSHPLFHTKTTQPTNKSSENDPLQANTSLLDDKEDVNHDDDGDLIDENDVFGWDRSTLSQQGITPIDQDLLRKYIAYARSQVHPVLHDVDSEKIALLYAELRTQSERTGGVPIAVRHLESIVRMAEAHARMHLRDHVRRDDVDMAIKITKDHSKVTEVYVEALSNRAKEVKVFDLRPFFSSSIFKQHGFSVDHVKGVIRKVYD
eukprot:gene3925-4286_t